MNAKQQTRDMVSAIVLVLALAGSLFAFDGWARASEAGSTEPAISAEQEAPDLGVTGQGKSWWQRRQERRRARAEVYRERIGSLKQEALRNDAVAPPVPVPAAALTGIKVSFKLDPRLMSGVYGGERWVSPPTYSSIQDGKFTVEARVQGRDTKGQLVDINPDWVPADPQMVTVSPGRGRRVTITVHRAGQSSVRVTVPGESEEASVSTELSVKAWYQGALLQAEISPSAVTKLVRQEQSRSTVRNGWRFVDGDPPREEQSHPNAGNGWKFVDGDLPADGQE